MTIEAKGGSPVVPCLRYEQAAIAIDFLCDAFGFARHAVYANPQDPSVIFHAQLTLGTGMVMLGSAAVGHGEPDPYNWRTTAEAGGITQSICCFVADPDAHAETAKAAGARIIRGPYDNQGYPGRAYDALDTEGNVWNFGSYDPWASPTE